MPEPQPLAARAVDLTVRIDQMVRDPRLILLLPKDARDAISDLAHLVAAIAAREGRP